MNGVNTQGENIADNGGIHEAFRAYKNSVQQNGIEPRLPGLQQYTPEQMFYIGYGQVLYIAFKMNIIAMVVIPFIYRFGVKAALQVICLTKF